MRMNADELLRHGAFLRRLAASLLRGEEGVDDVIQHAYLKALEGRPRHPRAWLAKVVRNLVFERLRLRSRARRRERVAARRETLPSPADYVERLEVQRQVVAAVLSLKEPYRSTIMQRYFDELTPREIARRSGVPYETVRTRLGRALRELRRRLDAEHASWALALAPLLLCPPRLGALGGVLMSAKKTTLLVSLPLFGVAVGIVWLATVGPSSPDQRAESVRRREEGGETPEKQTTAPAVKGGTKAEDAKRREPGPGLDPPSSTPKQEPEQPLEPYRLTEHTGDPSTCALRVLVVDENEIPWHGATVWLSTYENPIKHETGADGVVEILGVTPGKWHISAIAGSLQRSITVELVGGRKTEATVVIPHAGALVEGVVRHAAKGLLAEVTVRLSRRHARFSDSLRGRTSEAGRYRIEAVPPGIYRVEVMSKVLGPWRRCADLNVTGPGTFQHDLEVGIVSLDGVVRDAVTGRPIPAVTVLRQPVYGQCSTDSEGVYRFYDLPVDKGRLVLSKDGYEVLSADHGELKAGETRTLDITLKPAAILHLYVTDEQGRPFVGPLLLSESRRRRPLVAGGTISGSTGVTTDAEGHAVYRRISPGMCDLHVRRDGFRSASKKMEIKPGENTAHFRLEAVPGKRKEPGPRVISGTVVDAATGRPIPGARVGVWPYRRHTQTAVSDAEGNYCLRGGLQPGKYRLHVSRDGYGFHVIRDVEVVAGEERTLDITLQPAAILHLRVTDAQGRPVIGRVLLGIRPVRKDEGTRVGTSVTADELGRATYRQIVPGSFELRFQARERGECKVRIEILPGENTVEVRLE
jgi:RNA polymerase sigma-70 factor (ECF subfamily)